jgi:peptide/nickel transport system substrate-binding protein
MGASGVRAVWLFAGAALAVLVAAGGATGGPAAADTPAAPSFERSFAAVPKTPARRRARRVLVFGQEQDVGGFNTALTCCDEFWAGVQTVPVIRGAFITNDKLQAVKDLVVRARATPTTLSYTIRPKAYWNWGGRKIPVTYEDFVYTWQALVNPANAVALRSGYDQITGFTHRGAKQVTFTWAKPYAAWQSLFRTVFPAAALTGTDFNRVWTSCICGSDGKPVSDGPFMLTNYTKGVGSTLRPNPFWYGAKPKLREVDFKVVADTNAEVQAMRRGAVDAINPTFDIDLLPLESARGITYRQVPGLYQEHLDLQFGSQGQPLLRAPWLRRALMLGINRDAIISTLYGQLAGGTKPLDSLLFYPGEPSYRPDFRRWSFNPRRALALLRRHCTDGPAHASASNTSIWVCSGIRASFRYAWTASDLTRTTQETIIKAQLRSIGIEIVEAPLPAKTVFGPTGIPSSNYDLANFAWITTGDPADFAPVWGCGGESNYLQYCNRVLTQLLDEAAAELDPARRLALFQRADALLASDLPSIPLYARPDPLIRRSAVAGMRNNPSASGFAWNMEQWRWKR